MIQGVLKPVGIDEIVSRAAGGDRRCFERLYAIYARHIELSVRSVLRKNSDDIQACTQEAWLKIWIGLARYDPAAGAFTTWSGTLARHVAIDVRRREGTRIPGGATYDPDLDLRRSPADRSTETVGRGLNEILRLWALGVPYQGIAAALDIPIGTVKSRIFHARRNFRAS